MPDPRKVASYQKLARETARVEPAEQDPELVGIEQEATRLEAEARRDEARQKVEASPARSAELDAREVQINKVTQEIQAWHQSLQKEAKDIASDRATLEEEQEEWVTQMETEREEIAQLREGNAGLDQRRRLIIETVDEARSLIGSAIDRLQYTGKHYSIWNAVFGENGKEAWEELSVDEVQPRSFGEGIDRLLVLHNQLVGEAEALEQCTGTTPLNEPSLLEEVGDDDE